MPHRHAGYLDVISARIRMRHHKALSRAQIVRGLLEFMVRSGIDFSQFSSSDAMVRYLVVHLRGKRSKPKKRHSR